MLGTLPLGWVRGGCNTDDFQADRGGQNALPVFVSDFNDDLSSVALRQLVAAHFRRDLSRLPLRGIQTGKLLPFIVLHETTRFANRNNTWP